jgi:hypothetical protein
MTKDILLVVSGYRNIINMKDYLEMGLHPKNKPVIEIDIPEDFDEAYDLCGANKYSLIATSNFGFSTGRIFTRAATDNFTNTGRVFWSRIRKDDSLKINRKTPIIALLDREFDREIADSFCLNAGANYLFKGFDCGKLANFQDLEEFIIKETKLFRNN